MNDIQIERMLDAHVNLQLGTYFDKVFKLTSGVKYASSDKIKDFYWNYAYNIGKSLKELPKIITEIRDYSKSISRECIIYGVKDNQYLSLLDTLNSSELEDEIWMVYKAKEMPKHKNKNLTISILSNSNQNNKFIKVFMDAYGSGSPDSPGYTGLPDEYIDAIQHSKPIVKNVNIDHFIGYLDGKSVSISSIFYSPPYAGIYNVGTIHEARKLGCAWDLSAAAIKRAMDVGCKEIFLQTQEGSVVEEFYSKLGFVKGFVGGFLKL